MEREELENSVKDLVDGLNFNSRPEVRKGGIDYLNTHCQKMFGRTWAETQELVFGSLESLAVLMQLDHLYHVVIEYVPKSHMLCSLPRVWLLWYFARSMNGPAPPSDRLVPLATVREDMEKDLQMLLTMTGPCSDLQLLYVAPVVAPMLVKFVLAGYGITVDLIRPES